MSNVELKFPSNDLTITLIIEIFLKNLVPNLLTQNSSEELSLQLSGESNSIIGFNSILETLNQKTCPGLIGNNGDEQKVAMGWLKSFESFQTKKSQVLKELDSYLQSRTFMIGKGLTAIDLVVFTKLHSYIQGAVQTDLTSHPSITRHFDFIQNYPSVKSTITTRSLSTLPTIPINVEDVPEIKRTQAPAVKKEKKEAKPNHEKGSNDNPNLTKEATSTLTVSGEGIKPSKKKPEKEKKKDEKDGKKASGSVAVVDGPPMPHMIDMRVGKIIHVEKHPDADSLYVEKIDFGEAEPRTVVSGLVNYIPIEEMREKLLVGICNLKPANMRGVKSFAMVLAATSKDGKGGKGSVELVEPPVGSLPGDRVYFEGFEKEKPIEQFNPKKKQFEVIQPNFTTLETKEACWKDPSSTDGKVHKIITEKGVCFSPNFIGASLS